MGKLEYIQGYDGEYESNSVYIKKLTDSNFKLGPAKEGDAGWDLPTRISLGVSVSPDITHKVSGEEKSLYIYDDHFFIPAGGRAEIPTGFRIKVPDGMWGNIRARSSTTWKKSLVVADNTLDSGYVGPCYVLVFNPTDRPFRVNEGDRLAQLVLIPKANPDKILIVDEMPETKRGVTGFGSTGEK